MRHGGKNQQLEVDTMEESEEDEEEESIHARRNKKQLREESLSLFLP